MVNERMAYVSPEEAARVWKRATELHGEAARRLEERSRDLHASGGLSLGGEVQHLATEDVLAAGREVGIDPQFLQQALEELRAERAAGVPPPPDVIDRLASRFLGGPPSTVEASRTIDAPVETVYAAMQQVFPSLPYRLRLRDTLGEDPLRDAILVFDAPSQEASYSREVLLANGTIRHLYVTLRAVSAEAGDGARMTLHGSVEADHEPAFWLGSLLVSGTTGTGGVLGAAAAAGFSVSGPLLLVPLLGTAALMGGPTWMAYRSRYNLKFRRALRGFHELLEIVEATVKTRGGFLPARAAGVGGLPARSAMAEPRKAEEASS